MSTSIMSTILRELWVVPTTATTMILALGLSEPFLPSQYHKMHYKEGVRYEWEVQLQNPYFQLAAAEDIAKIEIIAGVTKKLLENAEPLDPSFSKIVSDHFWEMV